MNCTNQQASLFEKTLAQHNLLLTRNPLEILQINMGKLCNQACLHCHVDAGPKRGEIMEKKTILRLLQLMDNTPSIHTVDLTGGAPELNPNFRYLITEIHKRNKTIIDRCNLTILFEKGQEETAHFLREHSVKIIASLPCYSQKNVESQRGRGVFDKSIRALQLLNSLGYGKKDTGLELDLVYNPLGASLPPSQSQLETDYKKELLELFAIEFNHLYTITNMPIKRFLEKLRREEKHDEYMSLLVNNFNRDAAKKVMCRNLISIAWDGKIYDCDFNQMLETPTTTVNSVHTTNNIWTLKTFDQINTKTIALGNHCFACAAGAGSSCGGSLI